jgi:hypothetical protein
MANRSSTSHRQQSKTIRAQSRPHSSSSDERVQPPAVHLISPNDTSDEDADDPNSILSHHSRLRRKFLKDQQVPPSSLPLSQQQQLLPPTSSKLKYALNGILLRSKSQHRKQSTRAYQTSSKDTGKKHKRFTLDAIDNRWHQQLQTVPNNQQSSESNITRSSMAIALGLHTNTNSVQINNSINHNSSLKLPQQREDLSNELQQRPKVNIQVF